MISYPPRHCPCVCVCVCACAHMSWDVHPYLWWSTLRKMGWKQVVPTKQNWVQIMTLTSDIPPGHHLSNSVFILTKCSCNFLGVIQNCISNWFSHIFRSSSFPGGSQPTSWNHVVASVPRCYRSALWWSCGSSLHSARHVAVLKVMEVAGEDVKMSIVFNQVESDTLWYSIIEQDKIKDQIIEEKKRLLTCGGH